MNPARRKSMFSLALAAAFAVSGAAGVELFEHSQFARAESPAVVRPVANSKPESPEATHEQIAKAEDLSTVFRTVGKQMGPSVVSIQVERTIKGSSMRDRLPEDFLRRFGKEFPDMAPPDQDQGPQEEIGTGSGVVMENTGSEAFIVTNNHVAGGAQKITVTLNDGRQMPGTLVGADPKSDIAVVKIKGDKLPPAAHWGNSDDLQQGDWIMAFGSPFGYVGSMTHGIVSALDRTNVGILGRNGYEDFIQVDAPINPGNSGGPLVNLRGDVVGINAAIATRAGGFEGIGFAIPSKSVKHIYQELKEHGKVVRGWLGVGIMDVAKQPDVAKSFGYDKDTGVLVEETFNNTPAQGKLQNGDIITAINGKSVDNVTQLRNTIADTPPDTDITLQVFRGGKTQDVQIKLGTQPADLTAVAGGPTHGDNGGPANNGVINDLGLTLQNLTPELAQQYNITLVNQGAVITAVAPHSLAARKGLVAGDVITNVDRTKVTSGDQAIDLLKKGDLKKGVLLYVVSQDGSRFVVLNNEK